MSTLRTETTANLVIEMTFTDETKRQYTLPDVANNIDTATIAQKVKAINNGTAENVQDFRATFVSKEGAAFSNISAATLTVTTEEILYNSPTY